MSTQSRGGRLFELVPAGRIEKYLDTVSRNSGFDIALLDGGSSRLVFAPSGDAAASCADAGVWDGLANQALESPGELAVGGGMLFYVPVRYRGDILGQLAVHAPSGQDDGERARRLLDVTVSHIEFLAEAGYEMESLSGEVVRVYEELALVYGLISRLGAMVDVHEICRVVAEEVINVLGARDVMIMLADEAAGVFRTALAMGEHRAEAMGYSPGLEAGLVGASYVGHRPIIVCEVDQDRRHAGWPYHIRRLLAVPLMSEGRVIGMLVATDKHNGSEFVTMEEKLISAMAAVAAISLKNAQLYNNIKSLFEGFINAAVTAVESRDPTTAGHSERVAYLTTELARRVSESDLPPFKDVNFTENELMELHYAGLLHDFGKIGVKESVLLKDRKLTYERIGLIRDRFGYIAEQKKSRAAQDKLELALGAKGEELARLHAEVDARLAEELADIGECARLVESANNPKVLLDSDDDLGRLEGLGKRHYEGPDGSPMPFLTRDELDNLRVRKGSLNDEERRDVESHVMHSYNFLNRVPWSKGFANMVEIVLAHHERMDGSGYPRGIKGDEIPLQAKMMAIADVYDALTAWDRPYKDAVSHQKAMFILEMQAAEGKLEPHLVQLFRDTKVHARLSDMLPDKPGKKGKRDGG